MTSEYSNPAPQRGIELEAERLAAEIGSLRGYAKSIADHHNSLVDLVKSIDQNVTNVTEVTSAILAKAEKEDEDEKGKREKDAKKENCEKASDLFAEAREFLTKADHLKSEIAALEDEEKIQSLKAVVKQLRKAGARLLAKAKVEALAGRGESVDFTYETRKGIAAVLEADLALDTLVKASCDDDDDDDDEDSKKKAKKAYEKAVASLVPTEDVTAKGTIVGHKDAKGNQSDKKDSGDSDNQDDSAVKAKFEAQAVEMNQKIDDALSGFAMLKTNVQGLMDIVSGRTTTPQLATTAEIVPLIKSVGDNKLANIAQKIETADEAGALDIAQVIKARDLLNKLDAVQHGAIHDGVFKSALSTAPTAVRELFDAA